LDGGVEVFFLNITEVDKISVRSEGPKLWSDVPVSRSAGPNKRGTRCVKIIIERGSQV
jgi:hypothetical protein